MMKYKDFSEDIKACLEVLKKGGIILYPTDTIWGIGCDATNEKAVRRIYQLKQREDSKSMLVLMENENLIPSYIETVPELAWQLMDASDSPLTLILPGAKNFALSLIADDGSIGIRITKEAFSSQLVKSLRKPLVSTSANISGHPSPANFSEISDQIKDGVDYVVEYRQDDYEKKQPSGIIKLDVSGKFQILRK